jgi:dipeptidyl aminopeptidase/acylaminoacyl peptidase
MAVAGIRGISALQRDGDDLYWIQTRPSEEGREVLVVRRADGTIEDVSPAGVNVRSRVHEYGGGAYAVRGGLVVYSDFESGILYRLDAGAEPRPITSPGESRYADLQLDPGGERVIAVREDHTGVGTQREQAQNELVAIPLDGGADPQVLVSGHDFFGAPRSSPDGGRLAWLAWDHPDMPWDATELWVAELDEDGRTAGARRVAGGPGESVAEPLWAPDGSLCFVSDRTGWWNLYRLTEAGREEPLAPLEAEFSYPAWLFGGSSYGFGGSGDIICTFRQAGRDHLARIRPGAGRVEEIQQPFTEIGHLRVGSSDAVFIGSDPRQPNAVARLDLETAEVSILHESGALPVDAGYLSEPDFISYPAEDGSTAFALFYPPTNPDFRAPAGERPPLVVMTHGGPTAAAWSGFNPWIQFFTSRGFAVLDVDYGGSVGYGRAYRQRLEGQWGVVDVGDVVAATGFVCEQGLADRERTAIRGGSAGGFTTLAALTFRDVFRAGASYFGLGDLSAFVSETHKFESRYLDRLVGPYPERADLYRDRSPINSIDRLSSPLLVLQGLDDRIVPPAQAEQIVAALRQKQIPYAYLAFEGEDHGFRGEHAIRRSLEAELSFYARIFGFPLADPIEPVRIEGIDPPLPVGPSDPGLAST